MREISIRAGGRALSFVDSIDHHLAGRDGWDADAGSVHKIARRLPPGSTCIDVGACIGISALSLAVQRPDCHVIAIEPVPANFESLQRNVHANGITNVEIVNAALGDAHGALTLTNNGPWSSVIAATGGVRARAITLDDFADRDIAFVKIDAEGYEPYVLSGARRLLETSRPLVQMKFNTCQMVVHQVDPMSFAAAVWASCDVLGAYFQEEFHPAPESAADIIQHNIRRYGGVADLLLKPRSILPGLDEMICSPHSRPPRLGSPAREGALRA